MRNGEYFLMTRNTALTIARSIRDRRRLTTRRGFTLVEMVVVLLVIGILAAIAIPRYSGSKDKAYLAAMKADLVSAAIYEEQYAAENHGQYFSGVARSANAVSLRRQRHAPGGKLPRVDLLEQCAILRRFRTLLLSKVTT